MKKKTIKLDNSWKKHKPDELETIVFNVSMLITSFKFTESESDKAAIRSLDAK